MSKELGRQNKYLIHQNLQLSPRKRSRANTIFTAAFTCMNITEKTSIIMLKENGCRIYYASIIMFLNQIKIMFSIDTTK